MKVHDRTVIAPLNSPAVLVLGSLCWWHVLNRSHYCCIWVCACSCSTMSTECFILERFQFKMRRYFSVFHACWTCACSRFWGGFEKKLALWYQICVILQEPNMKESRGSFLRLLSCAGSRTLLLARWSRGYRTWCCMYCKPEVPEQ